jgi:protease-4
MLQFFKYVLATIAGLFLFFVLFFFVLVGIGSFLGGSDSVVSVSEKSVLKINLNQEIVENASASEDPFAALFDQGVGKIGLVTIKAALANAKLDPNIKGVFLSSEYPMAGYSTLGELRLALEDFKKTGKFVYAYGEVMTEKAVYINSVADRLFVNKAGGIELNGLYGEVTFYKGLFDKVGVKPLIFKVGEFKSAVEPYFRKDMSEANRTQVKSYINAIAGHIYKEIADSRGLTSAEMQDLLNNPVNSVEEALKKKVITDAVYYDEFEAALREVLEIKESAKISFIDVSQYAKAKKLIAKGDRNNRIAVIVGQGNIVSGTTDGSNIASESWVSELRKAVKDSKVKAIILRINSGGGSALASDVMWREIELAKKEKLVYASMGDYAASGGYYMAMGCDTIFSNPTTLTGSIGIFGLLVNTQELMNNKLGITFDGVESHDHSDFPSVVHEMEEAEKMMIQNSVERGYEKFTSKAAEGRRMKLDSLKLLAGGRVWTGSQAKENGLVDIIGTLEDAIELAAEKVDISEDFSVRYYPAPKSDIELIIDRMMDQSSVQMEKKLGLLAPYIKEINALTERDKIQAKIPFDLEIK